MEIPDTDPPDAATHMFRTKAINAYLGTAYSLEEVAEMDPLVFTIMAALQRGLDPPKKGKP